MTLQAQNEFKLLFKPTVSESDQPDWGTKQFIADLVTVVYNQYNRLETIT